MVSGFFVVVFCYFVLFVVVVLVCLLSFVVVFFKFLIHILPSIEDNNSGFFEDSSFIMFVRYVISRY